jgi:asparagine synthase (glutamine-hydrolysing)
MAHSLEVRVPFLDHNVVELSATIPNRLKVDRRLTRKVILRRVADGLVPARVLEKRKIGFFSHAVEGWFRAQADGAVSDWLLRSEASVSELFDPIEIGRLVDAWKTGRRTNARLLLALLMLEIWLSDTMPKAVAAESTRSPATA